jgi:heme exporter protein C
VNGPIIHYSVVWWNSLHQTSSVLKSGGPAMPASMLWPLLIMAFAFKFYYGWILYVRMRNHILSERQNTAWAKSIAKESLKQNGSKP